MSATFQFKQFAIQHGNGSWQVGTDSVLLGSWCRLEGVTSVLDIGTGSGILSLMIAQRSLHASIDAVEISELAIAEATLNIRNSKWTDRVRLIEGDIMENWRRLQRTYDLIVCNPPFYPEIQTGQRIGLGSVSEQRRMARQGKAFSIYELPTIAKRLLSANGWLCVVVPEATVYRFIEEANTVRLYVRSRVNIRHTQQAPIALVLLELSAQIGMAEIATLVLYDRNVPTPEYRILVGEYISI